MSCITMKCIHCIHILSSLFRTEIQQWLVDRATGEGRLWYRLHSQSFKAWEFSLTTGTEKESLPRVRLLSYIIMKQEWIGTLILPFKSLTSLTWSFFLHFRMIVKKFKCNYENYVLTTHCLEFIWSFKSPI